ncbi:MAG: hypothetical protein A2Z03_04475 [Chloroflexi bacterium RBG_16_56_8]|nr:MAG: hypothetical protein A2Z03_04475 [Chloroflexi bacterium RBG_16_56_8]
MSFYFFDTSALVKHYRSEIGSERVNKLFADANSMVFVSELAIVEIASSFQRLKNRGEIDEDTMNKALARFNFDTTGSLVVLGFRSDAIQVARQLVLDYKLRTLDALQMASALAFKLLSLVFVCADSNLLNAAKANGFLALNPLEESPTPR